MVTDELAITLRDIRLAANFTQAELAARIGMNRNILSSIERAQTLPTRGRLHQITSACGAEDREVDLEFMRLCRLPEVIVES
jgi:transcriptional regulator with XRE-family HTH domain